MIKVKYSTKDTDKGWKAFRLAMEQAGGAFVTVGVHENAGTYQNGVSVGEVALWNEFGTENIPERSFVRSTYDENEAKIAQWTAELLAEVSIGLISMTKALETLGFRYQVLIQNKITSGPPPANAPATLAAKQRAGVGSTPLNWTKLLLRSIGYKVGLK